MGQGRKKTPTNGLFLRSGPLGLHPAGNTEKLEGGCGGRWQCPVLTESTLLGLSLEAALLRISKSSCLQPSQLPRGPGTQLVREGTNHYLSFPRFIHSVPPSPCLPLISASLPLAPIGLSSAKRSISALYLVHCPYLFLCLLPCA